MPAFKEVFSTTWKVLLALFLISLGLGLAYFIMRGIGSGTTGSDQSAKNKESYSSHDTSDYRTKMPKFVWDKRAEWAIGHHCYFAGMSKAEIIQALGQPTEDDDYDNGYGEKSISYSWQTEKCTRYNGDECAEHEKQKEIVFLQNGYASSEFLDDYSCKTLHGERLPIPQFKTPVQEQAEAAARAAQNKKRDAANMALRARIYTYKCRTSYSEQSNWGWFDLNNPSASGNNCHFSSQEEAVQEAMQEARLGMAFNRK